MSGIPRIVTTGPTEVTVSNRYVTLASTPVRFPGTLGDESKDGTHWVFRSGTGEGAVSVIWREVRGIFYTAFVRQYRFPVGRETLELPGGFVGPGETPGTAAIREACQLLRP